MRHTVVVLLLLRSTNHVSCSPTVRSFFVNKRTRDGSGNPIITIKHSFQDACKKASIKDFRFHDLRHTFNTNMRKAGVDRSVIMKITGHKTMSMFERYNTVDSDDARSAMTQFEKHLQDKVTAILL